MSRRTPKLLTREGRERHEAGHCTNKRNGAYCTNYTGGANGSPYGYCEDCDNEVAQQAPVAYAKAAREFAAPGYYR
jgi:hypothetical protein